MKKAFSLILSVIMSMMLCSTMSAAVIEPGDLITPHWAYMNSIEVDVNFSGTTGTATAAISRIYGVTTLLEGTLTVYEKVGTKWVEVDSVSDSSTRILCLEFEFDADSGTTYKAELEITAYGSNNSESDTVSKTKKCP